MSEDLLRTGFDPSRRELCPDGACIGVIGSNGRCRECGKVSPGGPPKASQANREKAPKGATPPSPRQIEGNEFDPTKRELCPDGACVGVIGPEGRCKECGKPSPKGPPAASAPPAEQALENDADASPFDGTGPAYAGRETGPADGFDPTKREVCPDGACIGIIGPDGRCKECGRQAE